ncbi:hypothetical protein KAR34_13325 [bacterium]|nr:hypothetical protein [bacterium]
MQILKPTNPILVELSDEDITIMHLAFYEYKDLLKRDTKLRKDKKCERLTRVRRMITLVDLLM